MKLIIDGGSTKMEWILLDEETVKKIFDKYYQHDTTSVAKGSGIGLAIVKRIVSLCGGTIEVASWVGGGSSFTVKLPRK